jgi:hypothetical protein
MNKFYIGVTTIPPRIQSPLFKEHMIHLLQQDNCEKIFITIPKQYQRFILDSQCQIILNELLQISCKFEIIEIETDYGPACKFLGPLLYKCKEIQNNVLIIIDDDRFYNPQMTLVYKNFFQQYPNIDFVTGNQNLYFQPDLYSQQTSIEYKIHSYPYVAAFMSFAFIVNSDINELVNYTLYILKHIPPSFFHDEGILLNYLKFKDKKVFLINYQFINQIDQEMTDSLIEGKFVNRRHIENQIRLFTNQSNYFHKKISKLNFYKKN